MAQRTGEVIAKTAEGTFGGTNLVYGGVAELSAHNPNFAIASSAAGLLPLVWDNLNYRVKRARLNLSDSRAPYARNSLQDYLC